MAHIWVDGKVDEGLDDPTLLIVAAKSAPFISNREQSRLPTLPLSLFFLSSALAPLAIEDTTRTVFTSYR